MRHQKGVSYIGILFAVIGFSVIAKIAIGVWGPMWDDRVIDGQIEEVLKAAPLNQTPDQFKKQLSSRLDMNNVRDVKLDEIMQITTTQGLQVKKNYEVRKNFMMNIDLLMKFEKDFDQSAVKAK